MATVTWDTSGNTLISNIRARRAKGLMECMFEEFAYGDGDISSIKTLSKMMIYTVKRREKNYKNNKQSNSSQSIPAARISAIS